MSPLVKHVDKFGNGTDVFVSPTGRYLASVGDITDELDAPGGFSFSLPLDTPLAETIDHGSEIQVWEDGIDEPAWGYIDGIEESTSGATANFTCRGLLGLLGERYVGDTEREDLLAGQGSFDGPGLPAGWTAVGCTPTVETDAKVLGARALKLVKTVGAGGDAYYEKVIPAVSGGTIGLYLTLAGYRRVDAWAENLGRRGFYLEGRQAAVTRDVHFTQLRAEDVGPWDDDEIGIWIPNGETWDIHARLNAAGTVRYDEVILVAMDSISTGPNGMDQRVIAEMLVTHAQSSTYGKTHEAIVFPPGGNPDTGVVRIRHYQHVEAANILSALQEMSGLVSANGMNFWIECTAFTRTFRVATRRGVHHAGLAMSTAPGGRLAWCRRSSSTGKNSIRIQASGDGPDRREAGAKDLAALGGKSFELVDQAPNETPLDGLADKAAGVLASRKQPRTYDLHVHPGAGVYGVVKPGDTFPATIDKGRLTYTGDLRAIKVIRHPRTLATTITAVED